MLDNHTSTITRHDLETIVAASASHMADALETHRYPDSNLFTSPEGAAFSTFLITAADLHRAARSLALDNDLTSEEVRNAVQDAAEGVDLLAGFLNANARKRRN